LCFVDALSRFPSPNSELAFLYLHNHGQGQSQVRLFAAAQKIGVLAEEIIARTIVVRLLSTARTGFFYTMTRQRLKPPINTVKYDPVGALVQVTVCYVYSYISTTTVKARVLFVESKKSKK